MFFRRFQRSSYKDLQTKWETELSEANNTLPTKDYLEVRDQAKHRVVFAYSLLAEMLGVHPEEFSSLQLGESCFVLEENFQAAYSKLIEPQLYVAKRRYDIKQKMKKDKEGHVVMTEALKRNVVKAIFEKGLGLKFVEVLGKKSNNAFVKPHEFSPELWRQVHASFGSVVRG